MFQAQGVPPPQTGHKDAAPPKKLSSRIRLFRDGRVPSCEMANLSETMMSDALVSSESGCFNKLESKYNSDYLKMCINYFEKRKIPYFVAALPCSMDDRKASKRPKRISPHNMYILFNSFYTKIRRPEWLSSPVMWKTVKAQKELSDFVKMFDCTQEMGKDITSRSSSVAESGKRRRSAATDVAEAQENCEQRDKLYQEFYNVLGETFKNGVAPAVSSIYNGVITRDSVTRNMELFKSVALKLPPASYVPTPLSKKRRAPVAKRVPVKQRREAKPPPVYASDNTQDTNMSE
ncbi:nuclear matrix associated phosphoprotein [Samia ricini nucleopolyhedrovirus]|nr:p31 [Philosamia cynthia ricini nucleopolyhedrovirus virus]BBD51191.1 nuclear matrix associated phosphoprotein [Samia ricini nucleopolyhedrovirus]BBD51343.1 nuclear matrix associated phosphoprotein [Samia ricini nucleopolyhedrovirus]BBD51495.1 nuclear matrix associated phosphoprotein [Samia ricini nucleopolyhedrovirus]